MSFSNKRPFSNNRERDRPYKLLYSGRLGGVWQLDRIIDGTAQTVFRVSTTVRRKWVHTDYPTKEAAIAAADGKVFEVAA